MNNPVSKSYYAQVHNHTRRPYDCVQAHVKNFNGTKQIIQRYTYIIKIFIIIMNKFQAIYEHLYFTKGPLPNKNPNARRWRKYAMKNGGESRVYLIADQQ